MPAHWCLSHCTFRSHDPAGRGIRCSCLHTCLPTQPGAIVSSSTCFFAQQALVSEGKSHEEVPNVFTAMTSSHEAQVCQASVQLPRDRPRLRSSSSPPPGQTSHPLHHSALSLVRRSVTTSTSWSPISSLFQRMKPNLILSLEAGQLTESKPAGLRLARRQRASAHMTATRPNTYLLTRQRFPKHESPAGRQEATEGAWALRLCFHFRHTGLGMDACGHCR